MTKNTKTKNKVIALTGGIGSGKSQALKILEQAGEITLSCDAITLELYDRQDVKTWLAKTFPNCLLQDGKTPDKKKISQEVFADKNKLVVLTEFLTPLVLEECLLRARAYDKKVFVEVPLLFEQNAQKFFDGVLVIVREKNERVKSVMERNKLTEQEVLNRISSQFDYDTADLSHYVVIVNDGSLEKLKDKVLFSISHF